MTEPSRSPSGPEHTEIESREPLDPTLMRPDGQLALPLRERGLNFGPPESAGDIGKLGRYRVIKKLGEGGMGAVYLGHDTALARRVALKVMLPQYAADAESRERFLREARAVAMVRSDHVVTIFDVGEEQGIPFIAMEYLLGYPLDQFLRVQGNPSLGHVLRIGREIALGLAAAHKLGLVHRDVKPGNIWLEAPRGRVKLLDFGLARAQNEDTHLTDSGLVVGTPAFMSPEQARGQKLDGRSDLFSLGVVLYRLTTGRMPFTGNSIMAVLTSLAVDVPLPPRRVKPTVSEPLEAIITQLLAKDPADRFQTARAVVEAILEAERQKALAERGLSEPVPMAIAAQTVPAEVVLEGEESGSQPQVVDASSETEVVPVRKKARKKSARKQSEAGAPKWSAMAAAGVLLTAVLLAAFLLWPSKGTLVVESDDPEAEIVVKKDGIVVRDRTKDRELKLKVGTYTVELVEHRDGLTLSTVQVEIIRNGRTSVRVTPNRPVPPPVVRPPKAGDSDRKAAEYVLGIGGQVRVNADPSNTTRVTDLPKEPFTLTQAHLSGNTSVTDAGLAVLKGCNGLTFIDLSSTQVGDASMAYFKDCPSLTTLVLPSTTVSDAGLALLKDRTTLTYLFLHNTHITDAGLKFLKDHKSLLYLDIGGTVVTDEGLKSLIECWGLVDLKLRMSKVTRAGVLEFATMRPECQIEWDGGAIEPADRRAAEYALSVGGVVSVEANGAVREVKLAVDLPKEPFRLVALNISRTKKLTDAGLAAVRGCRNIKTLFLNETPLTDEGLMHFKNCTSLVRVEVYLTGITDAGLAALKDCRKLEYLAVNHTKVTDVGLAPFKDCPNLKSLFVKKTNVTPEFLAELKKARPRCKIDWDGGIFELKK